MARGVLFTCFSTYPGPRDKVVTAQRAALPTGVEMIIAIQFVIQLAMITTAVIASMVMVQRVTTMASAHLVYVVVRVAVDQRGNLWAVHHVTPTVIVVVVAQVIRYQTGNAFRL